MADCLIRANESTPNLILLAGTADCILVAPTVAPVVAEGGLSGGRAKRVGAEPLVDQQLGQRPIREVPAISTSKLKVRFESQYSIHA